MCNCDSVTCGSKLSGDDSQDSVITFSYSSLPDRFIGALFLPCVRGPGVLILFAKDTDPIINSTRIGRGLSTVYDCLRLSVELP